MTFASLYFAVFFIVAAALRYLVPRRLCAAALLAASVGFYASYSAAHVAVLAAVILATYLFGLYIDAGDNEKKRGARLAAAITVLLLILIVFKYARRLAGVPLLESIVPPIGLSFYTLAAIGYLIDVKRGAPAERNAVDLALFVSFFPSVLSGPIPRSASLLPQLKEPPRFDFDNIQRGFLSVTVGLFVKLVVADNLGAAIAGRYAGSSPPNQVLFSVLFFGIWIYADFMSYSLLAEGYARILGIRLVKNFKRPYFAQSVREFWRRWHISLSSWLRDYLYIPLGGSRCSRERAALNTLIVFAVSGLWHGEGLNFLVWGLLHGLYLVAETLLAKPRDAISSKGGALGRLARSVFVYALVDFAWIFFAASSLENALYVVSSVFSKEAWSFGAGFLSGLGLEPTSAAVVAAGLALLLVYDLLDERYGFDDLFFGRIKTVPRFALYYLLYIAMMFFGKSGAATFLYFNF